MGNKGSKVHYSTKTKIAVEGDTLPNVTLKFRIKTGEVVDPTEYEWRNVMSHDLFKGKRIVMFSIPGAFTPVCSCDHLPSYQKRYEEIKSLGIDDIYCVSVNDAFVMRQWGILQGLKEEIDIHKKYDTPIQPGNFETIKLIPDGAAVFSRGMGLTCTWKDIGGFGERSWRYSAVINDCKIEKLFLEEDGNVEDDAAHGPEPLEVSDGSTMVNYLASTVGQYSTKTQQ